MTATDTGALIKQLREHARFHDREAKISEVGSIGRMWHNDDAAILRQAADELDAARARIAELEKDAGRYRWLRENARPDDVWYEEVVLRFDGPDLDGFDNLDEIIDAAMALDGAA